MFITQIDKFYTFIEKSYNPITTYDHYAAGIYHRRGYPQEFC